MIGSRVFFLLPMSVESSVKNAVENPSNYSPRYQYRPYAESIDRMAVPQVVDAGKK